MHTCRLGVALVAGIVVAGLAACTTGPQAPPPPVATVVQAPPPPTAPPAGPPPINDVAQLSPVCPLLPGELIAAHFGGAPAAGAESPVQRLDNGAEAAQCTYRDGERAVAVLTVSIGRGGDATPQEMITAIHERAGNGERVEDAGAAALFHVRGEAAVLSSANTVGGTPVLVSVSGPGTTPREAYRALVTALVDRFAA